jgi:hemerythrin-like domain-containing protein
MTAIDVLIDEHKLIGQMITILQAMKTVDKADVIVDFFKTYADQCHHGKEEQIFFNKLMFKQLTEEHRTILKELLVEHEKARKLVLEFEKSHSKEVLDQIISLYIYHIGKENKFFIPALSYLNEEEQEMMELDFEEFDTQMMHKKYFEVVVSLK